MDKFSDLESDEKDSIKDQLESKATGLGLDLWNSANGGSLLNNQIGLCSNCKSLEFCKTEFDNIHARCAAYEFKLSGQNKIVECNMHSAKGSLSLDDMYDIAIIIDPPKRKSGFIG